MANNHSPHRLLPKKPNVALILELLELLADEPAWAAAVKLCQSLPGPKGVADEVLQEILETGVTIEPDKWEVKKKLVKGMIERESKRNKHVKKGKPLFSAYLEDVKLFEEAFGSKTSVTLAGLQDWKTRYKTEKSRKCLISDILRFNSGVHALRSALRSPGNNPGEKNSLGSKRPLDGTDGTPPDQARVTATTTIEPSCSNDEQAVGTPSCDSPLVNPSSHESFQILDTVVGPEGNDIQGNSKRSLEEDTDYFTGKRPCRRSTETSDQEPFAQPQTGTVTFNPAPIVSSSSNNEQAVLIQDIQYPAGILPGQPESASHACEPSTTRPQRCDGDCEKCLDPSIKTPVWTGTGEISLLTHIEHVKIERSDDLRVQYSWDNDAALEYVTPKYQKIQGGWRYEMDLARLPFSGLSENIKQSGAWKREREQCVLGTNCLYAIFPKGSKKCFLLCVVTTV
jgi:hypothetical protein